MTANAGYLDRLGARTAAVGTVLCLGIDPVVENLPPGFTRDLAGLERFCRLLIEVAGPFAAAVKPNLAFFEAYGSAGIAALERLLGTVPSALPVILDVKRADIKTTAARQAVALFDGLGADAITVNPYLGSDAIQPLIERVDRFAYVLCRTSNPGAGELQGLLVAADGDAPEEPLFARVARRVMTWGPGGTVGLVVGATAQSELGQIRQIAPDLPFLVPGIGAQGGEVEPVLRSGRATTGLVAAFPGGGLLVNVSRGIAGAVAETNAPADSSAEGVLAAAAQAWARRLPVLP